jgi:hypothetical protein
MRLILGAAAVSTLILIGFGAPPLSVVVGAILSSGYIWLKTAGARGRAGPGARWA